MSTERKWTPKDDELDEEEEEEDVQVDHIAIYAHCPLPFFLSFFLRA
jgi:hypothetical protein